MTKIIEYLLRFRPAANWICTKSALPYLKLYIQVPCVDILSEWDKVKHRAVSHRDSDAYGLLSNRGWKSLVLYGVSSTGTAESQGEMSWTDIAEQCPKTVAWITQTFNIDENTNRIRFMLLEPHGYIILHKDRVNSGLFEINVAITNPNGCRFRFKNYGTVPFEPGTAFMMDISNEHFVVNDSDELRLHIILHTSIDSKIIENSYANSYYN